MASKSEEAERDKDTSQSDEWDFHQDLLVINTTSSGQVGRLNIILRTDIKKIMNQLLDLVVRTRGFETDI